jgi:hypothetical protein
LARLEEFFGFSIPYSALIILGDESFLRLRPRISGGLGSFMKLPFYFQTQQLNCFDPAAKKNLGVL